MPPASGRRSQPQSGKLRNSHEKWRYIRYADGAEELYDMVADPREWTNLASQRRGVCAEMAKWIPLRDAGPARAVPIGS